MLDTTRRSTARVLAASALLVLAGLSASGASDTERLIPPGTNQSPALEDSLEVVGWIELDAADARAKADSTGRFLVGLEEVTTQGLAELWSIPLGGGKAIRLSGPMTPGDRIVDFAISPDGRRVAFTVSRDGGPRQLYEVPIAGGVRRRIDDDAAPGLEPFEVGDFAFRPDSRALGFMRQPFADSAMSPDGTPVVALLDLIFADGFESGDTSAWSSTMPAACSTPTGGPTLHANSVLSDETWTATGSPHVLTSNVLVPAGVTLTLEPCAAVRVRPGFDLTVRGTLVAVGTSSQRISFRRDVPASPWDSIWVRSPGVASLAFVDVSGGGAAGASLLVEGIDTLPAAEPLLVDHVNVIGSTSYGVRLFRRAAFAVGSRDLVVTGAGSADPSAPFPVRMSLNTVGSLPVGSYTGNASDLIQVVGEGSSAIEVDDVFHDRGVPYQIGGPAGAFGLIVVDGDPTLATMTVEPGVEIRFYSAGSNVGGLFVGTSGSPVATGRIVAAGTVSAPILLTGAGAVPTAGDWEGITFFGALAAGNLLDHVQIDAAGHNGGDANFGCPPAAFPETSGALKIFSQPSSQFLTNSTISRSSTHGVYRAWIGAQVDFLAGNTFDDVQFCNQVLPKPPLPALCPANPECPQ